MFAQATGVAKAPVEAVTVAALAEARRRTHALVPSVSDEDLERVHSTLMSPLVWDLGHIAAFEDLWIAHRLGGRPMLREDLADVYDAFETPRAGRGELPMLGPAQATEFLAEVRERSLEVIAERGLGDGIVEMVLRHEHQHTETMLQTLQLARLDGYRPPVSRPAGRPPAPKPTSRASGRAAWSWSRSRGGPARSARRRRGLPMTTSAPATRPMSAVT